MRAEGTRGSAGIAIGVDHAGHDARGYALCPGQCGKKDRVFGAVAFAALEHFQRRGITNVQALLRDVVADESGADGASFSGCPLRRRQLRGQCADRRRIGLQPESSRRVRRGGAWLPPGEALWMSSEKSNPCPAGRTCCSSVSMNVPSEAITHVDPIDQRRRRRWAVSGLGDSTIADSEQVHPLRRVRWAHCSSQATSCRLRPSRSKLALARDAFDRPATGP